MIIWIFVSLIIIALFLLAIAYFHDKNTHSNTLIGIKYSTWLILFLISINCMIDGLDYPSGATITTDAGTYYVTDTYTTYENHTGFFIMTVMCGFGFVIVFFENRSQRRGDDID